MSLRLMGTALRLKFAGSLRPYRPIQPTSMTIWPRSSRCHVRSAPCSLPTSKSGSIARAAVTPNALPGARLAGTNGTGTVADGCGADALPSTPTLKGIPAAQPGPGVAADVQLGARIDVDEF